MRTILILCLFILTSCGGKDGVNGKDGTNGTNGTNGNDGKNGIAIASHTGCVTSHGGYLFTFHYVIFSDGSVYVTCSVNNSTYALSSSDYYPYYTTGAVNSKCRVGADSDSTSSYGYWVFQNVEGTKTIQYSDSGSTIDGTKHTFTAGECS